MEYKNISDEFVDEARKLIEAANHIVIVSHKNPDGDAIGSGLAFYNYFTAAGKHATFILPDLMPSNLKWMPSVDKIITYKTTPAEADAAIAQADLVIMADFNSNSRMGDSLKSFEASPAKRILIDHHPFPEVRFDIAYSRPESSSTSELVYELLAALSGNYVLETDVATCLFTGIMTDTGCFNYNSSAPITFNIIAHLLESGINKDQIVDNVMNHFSETRLRMLGFSLSKKMKVLPQYQTAYIWLTKQELEAFNNQQGDTEGLVNYPLTIDGINFSALFTEKDGLTKCSFRSRGTFPANKVASERFSGGGHLNAAGGEFHKTIGKTIYYFEKVLPEYEEYLQK
ncbi:MAG: bifunctional oligoribonuclease/PAP phosphatase NrnA [Salinivirgaceae bacterium]|nr:bifunctional oligoribonuclease/PAP phosphatase NrnA [Salinivirgaceae bacterium]MBR5166633.1 bifunctional oligoribonuclease/PAP phosphatase NrnA [Salinivirgaceae bacterium]